MNKPGTEIWRVRRLWVILCILIAVRIYAAQNSATTGVLEGVVKDSSGAIVPSATITVRSTTTNQTRSISSAEDGSYRFPGLPAGDYEVGATVPGFALYKNSSITIPLGASVSLDITLALEGVSENVAVTDQPLPLDTAATAITTTIDPERIEELPVNSRNYLEFTLLAPGVAPSNPQQSGSALGDSGFIFGGLRPRSNMISIDGLDNTDETTGAARVALSPEIVREFQIINNGISAESGGAGGGAINVVTKTGSNDFHGDAFLFAQNDALNATDPFTAKAGAGRPIFHRYQPGLSLGGPLRRDRLFFYVAGEQEHRVADSASDISAGVRERLNLPEGRFGTASDETEAAEKWTYLAGRHTVNSRFAFTNLRLRRDAFNIEEFNDVSSRGSSFTKDYQLTGSDLVVLSPSWINEFRIQGSTRHALSRAGDRVGPEIDVVGQARFGRPYESEATRRETRLQVLDDLTMERGHDEIKAGITLNHVQLQSEIADGFGGVFVFRTLDDFAAGRAAAWRQSVGSPATDFGITGLGGFVQDRHQLIRRLTLNVGMRYDIERLPQSFRTRYNNISPRVGLAWNPSAGWVIRTGAGFYYDRIPLAFLNRAIQKDGIRAYELVTQGNATPSIFQADPAFATPYSAQTSVGVERLVTKDVTVRADYLFTRGIHLLRTRNANLMPPAPGPDGRLLFGPTRRDPRFDAIYVLESSAASSYHGLTLSLNKRLSDEFEMMASYTRSKTIDDASDFDEQPQNPYNLRAERGLSRQDVRNRFVVNALFDLPIGEDEKDQGKSAAQRSFFEKAFGHIEAAPIFTFSSGRPVNVITGADEEGSRAWPFASRPIGFGRNTFQTPRFVNVDLRLVKYIPYGETRRLDFTTEAFNLLNHPNVLGVNPFYGSGLLPLPGFGSATSLAAPRQIRFSIDLEF